MQRGNEVIKLPEEQYKIIQIIRSGVNNVNDIAKILNQEPSSLMRILIEMEAKGLIRTYRDYIQFLELTNEGLKYCEKKLPELKVIEVFKRIQDIKVTEIVNRGKEFGIEITDNDVKISIANMVKHGFIKIINGIIKIQKNIDEIERYFNTCFEILKKIGKEYQTFNDIPNELKNIIQDLVKRKLIRIRERVVMKVELTDKIQELLNKGLIVPVKVVTTLTTDLIKSGNWRFVELKKFDLSIELPRANYVVPHFMNEFINYLKEVFIELGFEEVKGPPVELEFWNFDVLFQAQDHPAREIHDTFYLKYPNRGFISDEELVKRVKAVHENGWTTGSTGWCYEWNFDKALNLILRTQTTSVTARELYRRKDGEYRVFTIDKVFRPETLDPKHSMEFYQADGIIVGKNVHFRHLLGILETIAKKLGIEKVMFKPAYFPFTCPSAEGYIWHDKLGWIEFVGCGIFRPEVVQPLGVKECKVLAFGIGVDRLAMTVLEIDDIRDLYTTDIEKLKEYYRRFVKFISKIR